ncbi:MAG: hypothetical protein JKY54_10390 [Flavobacteriales bacterium]|nr:hypothetical protein [Flavobacteriales bacterium]
MSVEDKTIRRLSQLMAFSFIAEMLICWKLWIPVGREFPMISAFESLPLHFGISGDGFLVTVIFISLALIIINKFKQIAYILMMVCFGFLILEDIARFQPWVYTQGIILLLLTMNKPSQKKAILTGVLLVIAGTYVWSGIHKLNMNFIRETFPWMLSSINLDFRVEYGQPTPTINYSFFLFAIAEIGCGILLLFKKFRSLAIICSIIMHLSILLFIGPLGLHWNHVVWPWNISLILVLVLFLRSNLEFNLLEAMKQLKINYVIAVLFFVMPFLNLFGYWDNNLSSRMYSGKHSNAAFYFKGLKDNKMDKHQELSSTLDVDLEGNYQGTKSHLTYWSIYDLKAPHYPADRYYYRIGKVLCAKLVDPEPAGIEIMRREIFSGIQHIERCSCEELTER